MADRKVGEVVGEEIDDANGGAAADVLEGEDARSAFGGGVGMGFFEGKDG